MITRKLAGLGLLAVLVLYVLAPADQKVIYEKTSPFNNIVVTEDGRGLRTLLFEKGGIRQSVVKVGDPDHLELPYARAMPVGLAMVEQPRRVLIVGLGGGTIPSFLHKHYPRMIIDVVDIDPGVVEVAKKFFGFREDDTMHAYVDDGRRFIEKCRRPYDVIFLDAFGSEEIPYHLATREFLQAVRRALTPKGVAVGNIWSRGSNRLYDSMVRTYQEVFDELYILDVRGAGNEILLALPRKQQIGRDDLARRAAKISKEKHFRFDMGELVKHGYRHEQKKNSRGRVLTDKNKGTDKGTGKDKGTDKEKPNFLIVIGDDVTYTDIGCYGGTNVKTPQIDRLAEEGLKFNYAYVAMSMCAPCRQELYSGLYPMRSGATWNHSQSRPGTKSICHYLRKLGYRVGLAGKHHASPQKVYCFDGVGGFERGCCSKTAWANQDGIRQFMTAEGDQPFCLVVALVVAHSPWTVGNPDRFEPDKLKLPPHFADTPEVRKDYAKYLAEIGVLDKQLGDILETLEKTGKADNTLVIFTSEQGGQWPGAKWTNWEQGLHTAFMARWPGKIKPGRQTDALIQYADVVPTLVQAAGGEPAELNLDGTSFLDVLLGKKNQHRKYVYGMHNNIPEGPPYPIRTIRSGQFRYIRNLKPEAVYIEKHMEMPKLWGDYWQSWKKAKGTDDHARKMFDRYRRRPAEELYRTNEDIYELDNLAANPQYAKIKAELRGELEKWMKAQGDPGAALDTRKMYNANRNMGRKPRK